MNVNRRRDFLSHQRRPRKRNLCQDAEGQMDGVGGPTEIGFTRFKLSAEKKFDLKCFFRSPKTN